MKFCTITWDLDVLAEIQTSNRDAMLVVTMLKALTDKAREESREDTPEVILTCRRMAEFGLSVRRIRQALNVLESTGRLSATHILGRAARVRLHPSFYGALKARKKGGWILA
jgi:hypothetical protein